MGVTVTKQYTPLSNAIVYDDGCYAVKANTTGTTGTLYMVEIDNSLFASAVYFRLVDATSATIGSTVPTMLLYCPASSRRSYTFTKGIAFTAGFTHWLTTSASESDDTEPSGTNPKVHYVINDGS